MINKWPLTDQGPQRHKGFWHYGVCFQKLLIGIADACWEIQDPISHQGSGGTILFTKTKKWYTEQVKQWHLMKLRQEKSIYIYIYI